MRKDIQSQKGFAHILIILIGIGLVILAGIFLWMNSKNKSNDSLGTNLNLPSCPKDYAGILTAPIMKDEAYNFISPLGNLNPGSGHIIPTDHMYMANTKGNKSANAEVFAAGDMWLTKLNESKAYDEHGNLASSAIGLIFHPCKEITIEYDVNELSPQLDNEFQTIIKSTKGNCSEGKKLHGLSKQCNYQLSYQVKAGQLLGWTNQNEATLDVGAYDTRITLPFINSRRFSDRTLHAICPFDLYSGELKNTVYQKLGGHSDTTANGMVQRTIEPKCGTVMQDVPGTAQGEWFVDKEPNPNAEFDGKVISIVHDNVDPSKAVINIAGTITHQAGLLMFNPKHEGLINREPKEVKDSNIYCFQNEFPNEGTGARLIGRILVQLTDEQTLKVEYQEKSCSENFNFISPIIYKR